MHADHAIDDELETRQTHALVGQLGEIEGAIRVADVHHDLERQFRHRIDGVLPDIEAQFAVEDQAGIAFGTGHGDALAVLQQFGGVAATYYGRDAQFAGNDRGVAGTSATIGDDGAGAFHHRLPVRIGHIRYQDVARLHLVHFGNVTNDLYRAGA